MPSLAFADNDDGCPESIVAIDIQGNVWIIDVLLGEVRLRMPPMAPRPDTPNHTEDTMYVPDVPASVGSLTPDH